MKRKIYSRLCPLSKQKDVDSPILLKQMSWASRSNSVRGRKFTNVFCNKEPNINSDVSFYISNEVVNFLCRQHLKWYRTSNSLKTRTYTNFIRLTLKVVGCTPILSSQLFKGINQHVLNKCIRKRVGMCFWVPCSLLKIIQELTITLQDVLIQCDS